MVSNKFREFIFESEWIRRGSSVRSFSQRSINNITKLIKFILFPVNELERSYLTADTRCAECKCAVTLSVFTGLPVQPFFDFIAKVATFNAIYLKQ